MPGAETKIANLRRLRATDVKKQGWRGVMRVLREQGAVVVTNHNEAEAVILPAARYEGLMEILSQSESRMTSELDALRRKFDDRLASLQARGAGTRLRAAMRRPAKLRGKVKAGDSF